MTIEPARDVRRITADERAWLVAAALLIVACLATAFSVLRQWATCGASATSQDCLALRQTMNMLPIQADTMALRAPWAALFATLGLTLATCAWIAFLLLHPLGRSIKIAGALLAVPLLIMTLAGWFGVWSVESWVAYGGAWIILGTVSEFLAIGFLVYATMSREAVSLSTTQRLVILIFGVTAFGTMHQSAEFIFLAFLDQEGQGVPQYLGLGTALTLGLTGAAVIWLTLRARKKPRRHEVSILG
jgi:hypothetical protein